MKFWYQHGTEHSANLVMIGHFLDATEAQKAHEVIVKLTSQVTEEQKHGLLVVGSSADRYSDTMLDILGQLNVHSIGPQELEQFAYDVVVKVNGSDVILATDEIEVSAFLKVLFDRGARIEVYSAHDQPDTGRGR